MPIKPLDEALWNTLKPSLMCEKYIGSLCISAEFKMRQFLAIVIHVMQTGTTWVGLRRLGRLFEAAYQRFLAWSKKGIFERIFLSTIPKKRILEAQIDSTYLKVHRYAHGRKGSIGSGRGGPATKLHGLCDERGVWYRLMISPGNDSDIKHAADLVEGIRSTYLLADKGYDSNKLRGILFDSCVQPVIPGKRNRKVEIVYDEERYKHRHVVENGWLGIKDRCRIALRRDKLDVTFFAFIYLAAALLNRKKHLT